MKLLPALATLAITLAGLPARAADATDVEQLRAATARLVGLLVEQGVLARERGNALLREIAAPPPAAAPAAAAASAPAPAGAPATVRVPYVPEFVRKEIKEEIRADLAAQAAREGWAAPGSVPSWVRGLEWNGDLRSRFEFNRFPSGNAQAVDVTATNANRAITLLNTDTDRSRLLVRARAGLTAKADDNWAAGVRLTTGSTSNPLSSNQTLGNYGNRYTVAFDRAYIEYRQGDSLNVISGRFGNPWFGTDLVWANDLGFDGIAAQWRPRLNDNTRAFFTLAALPIQEVALSSADKWLLGGQAGMDLSRLFGNTGAKIGLGYYAYRNTLGQLSPTGSSVNNFTAPQFTQKGNTYYNIASDPTKPLLALAADYRLLNLTATVDVPAVAGKHVLVTADWVRNLGFDSAAVSSRVGTTVQPRVNGYLLRAAFGDTEVSRVGNWQVFAAYKYLQRDAVLDAFTDSDFHLGGTDARGYIVGASYGLGRNTAASLRLLSADAIDGAPFAVDLLQFEISLRF